MGSRGRDAGEIGRRVPAGKVKARPGGKHDLVYSENTNTSVAPSGGSTGGAGGAPSA